MKNFVILRFLDIFKGAFEKIGIEYDLMRKILQVKLTMDGRRVPTIISNQGQNQNKNNDGNNFIKSLWFYGLIGLFIIPLVLIENNFMFQMSMTFGIFMFMLMTSLISDFSSVLLDIRDKSIIFSKPVKSKTIGTAKLIHILIYMFMITISFTGPVLVVTLIKNGILFFLLFLFEIIFMDLFIVILTALFYMLILKFFDGEKLKDIINYVQIVLSLVVAFGYQLAGRLFNFVDKNYVFKPSWWQYFIVPAWFGAPFELLIRGTKNSYYIVLSILVILIPLLAIILYIRLMPSFERNIQKLNNNSSKEKKGHYRIINTLSKVVCFNKEERPFFKFASYVLKGERQFKLRVYPSLGLAVFFPVMFMLNRLRYETMADIVSGKNYLNIYFCAYFIPLLIMNMKYSEAYKGRWIYNSLPVKKAAPIYKGTLKALIARIFLPIYIFECIVFIIIFGVRIIPDLILALLVMLMFTVICFSSFEKELPFSKPYVAAQQGDGLAAIPLMLLLALLAGIHYLCTLTVYGIYIYMLIVLTINIILWKTSFNVPWEKVNNM